MNTNSLRNKFDARRKTLILVFACLLCGHFGTAICRAQPGEQLSPAAKAAFEKNDFTVCIGELTKIISREPNNDQALSERARCRLFNSELDLAVVDAEKALSLNQRNTAAYLVRGNVRKVRNDAAGAIADFSRAIELEPLSIKGYFNRAAVKTGAKNYDGAIADLTIFIKAAPAAASLALTERAQLRLTYKQDLDGALTDLTGVIELEPKNIVARVMRAQVKREKKIGYDQLAVDFNEIYKIDPTYLQMYRTFGKYCVEDNKECAALFKKAIELKPDETEFHLGYAKSVLKLTSVVDLEKRLAEAAGYLQKDADAPGAASEEIYLLLGNLYVALKDYAKAEQVFSKNISVRPKTAYAHAMRADYYLNRGEHAKAIADFTQALALDPNYAPVYRNRAIAYAANNDLPKAFADYAKAVELDPTDGIAFLKRGNLYYEQKDYARALTDLNQAIKLNADDECVKIYRGRIHLENNDLNRAAEDFDNYNSHAHWQKGCVLEEFYKGESEMKQTNYSSALNWYSRALSAFKSRGLDTAMVQNAVNRAYQAKENRKVTATGTAESGAAGNAQPATQTSQPSASDRSRATVAYYSAMQQYRTARANYQDAVAKYNRNIAANANMQGMMSGTVARAQTQLGIMRSAINNLLRDHGSSLPPDKLREVKDISASLPSSPF